MRDASDFETPSKPSAFMSSSTLTREPGRRAKKVRLPAGRNTRPSPAGAAWDCCEANRFRCCAALKVERGVKAHEPRRDYRGRVVPRATVRRSVLIRVLV